jgi:hypothetical protein
MMMVPMVTPMGMIMPMVTSAGPTAVISIPIPTAPIPVVPALVPTTLPAPQPVITPALSAKSLFKEARVSVGLLKLAAPGIFSNIKFSVQGGGLANFRDVTINSIASSIITPNVFNNIKIFSQIR